MPRKTTTTPKAPEVAFDIPQDFDDLVKALKSAKGVLWTMNHRGETDSAKIARQHDKIEALQAAYDDRKPPRQTRQAGPRWVVAVDPVTGKATVRDSEKAPTFAAEQREAGRTVLLVPKATP